MCYKGAVKFRVFDYAVRDFAPKHRISPATAHKIVKGIEKTIAVLVNRQVAINQELSEHNEHEVNRFKEEVDQRSKQIAFFNTAAMRNVTQAMKKPCLDQQDHKFRAETIAKGREVVLGKEPLAVVNNANVQKIDPVEMMREIAAKLPV